MTTLPIIANNEKALAADKEAMDWKAVAEAYVITTPEMAEAAAEDLRAIKGKHKELDGLRKELKQPSLDESKAVDKHFKKPLEWLKGAETVLKTSIIRFQEEEEAKLLTHANDNDPDDFAVSAVQEQTKLDGITTRKVWKARVLNRMTVIQAVANGELPDEILTIDHAQLDAMAKSLKGSMRVPGVEAYEERGISARS